MANPKKKVKRTIKNRIANFATLGAIVSLGALLSKHFLLFDLLSHFRVQYIVLLIPAFFVAIYAKRTKSLLVICFALAVHGYSVTMSMLPESMSTAISDTADFVAIKVLNSNLYLDNTEYDAQLDFIDTVEPDIIAFQEYTHEWHEVLSKRLTLYPHRVTKPLHGAFGIALYSKYPILSGSVKKLSKNSAFIADVKIKLNEKQVRVIGVHPPPPASLFMYDMRNEMLQLLTKESAQEDDALIMMGDFNATPWTSHFSSLLTQGKLRNARAGHGMHPTWPTNNPIKLIPIDHILVNPHVAVKHFGSTKVVGSDHRNIWSELHVY